MELAFGQEFQVSLYSVETVFQLFYSVRILGLSCHGCSLFINKSVLSLSQEKFSTNGCICQTLGSAEQGNCIKLGQTHVRLPESGRGAPCGRPLWVPFVGYFGVRIEMRLPCSPCPSVDKKGLRCPPPPLRGQKKVFFAPPSRPFVDKKGYVCPSVRKDAFALRCSPCPSAALRGQKGSKMFSVPLRGPPWTKRDVLRAPPWTKKGFLRAPSRPFADKKGVLPAPSRAIVASQLRCVCPGLNRD